MQFGFDVRWLSYRLRYTYFRIKTQKRTERLSLTTRLSMPK